MVEALNLVDPRSFADGPPHAFFDIIRREDPLHRIDDPKYGTIWNLTRHQDIRRVSANNALFSSGEGVMYPLYKPEGERAQNNMLLHNGAQHSRLRGLVQGALTPRIVAQFDHWIREICVRIIADIKRAGQLDAVPAIAAELPAQVISSILGIPDEDRGKLLKWAVELFGRIDPEIGFERALAARNRVEEYALHLRDMKRSNPQVDLATELLSAAPKGEPITEGEYRETVLLIMVAGFETTHTLIAQTLWLMARDEDARRQIESPADGNLSPVLEELLRYVSPVMHMARTATEEVEMHGKTIRVGDRVLMWYTAANRDPEVFADPHRFNAAREAAKPHMGFGGGGIHFCVGAPLAKLEVDILLQELAKAGIRLELDGTPQRSVDVAINALRKLPMRLS
jgi:cholest-4-en-3-one 26-monooxygenase